MIAIPNPCNEDFEKMSPTDKGAFCKVCSTDTYDFRHLSDGQIFQIVDDNKGKHVCGRFTKGQLENLNAPAFFAWKNQNTRTFQSKFMLACLLVFGLGLFSCNEEDTVGILEDISIEQVLQDVEPNIGIINGVIDPELANIDLLDYVVEPEMDIVECDLIVSGEVASNEHIQYTDTEYDDYVLGGVIAMVNEYDVIEPIPVDIQDSTNESTLSNQVLIDSRVFEATAFPNPTQDICNVSIDVETEGQFEIMMYNMNGQMVTSIHSGHLSEGRQNFEVSMQDFNSGMYIVKVISQGQDETLKVQKLN